MQDVSNDNVLETPPVAQAEEPQPETPTKDKTDEEKEARIDLEDFVDIAVAISSLSGKALESTVALC